MKLHCLRPRNLKEFIGKAQIKSNLKIYLKAAKLKNQCLDHCLFYGLPGTGKTSLAMLIANELKTRIKIIQGSSIQKNTDVYNLVLNLRENDILFIDEIHAINYQCYELFYNLMEDFCFNVVIGKEFNAKTTTIKVPHFTLIGATTSLADIPKPLEERFGITFVFEAYSNEEMKQIIQQTCDRIKFELSNQEQELISLNAKGIPRIAMNILARVYDFRIINSKTSIKRILRQIGIVKDGLNVNDLIYLRCFLKNKQQKTLGIKTLSQMAQFDIKYIETKIEPYLIKNDFVQKTSNGRVLLKNSKELLEWYEKNMINKP